MLRPFIVFALAVSELTAQQTEYRRLQVDASTVHGTLRSFQAVDGGPSSVMSDGPDLSSRYKEMHIEIVRTHDLYGPTEIGSHFSSSPLLALLTDQASQADFLKKANSSIIFF